MKSGRHPRKWVTPDGKKVPLIYHGKEIGVGIAEGILKQLNVQLPLRDFMAQ